MGASRVIAVDRSESVLKRARALASRRGVSNVIWKRGELEKLPIRDGSIDVALLSQALHHAADPALAIAERLGAMLSGAGLTRVKVKVGARRTGDPFTVLIARGETPGAAHPTPKRSSRTRPQR